MVLGEAGKMPKRMNSYQKILNINSISSNSIGNKYQATSIIIENDIIFKTIITKHFSFHKWLLIYCTLARLLPSTKHISSPLTFSETR